MKRTNWWEIRDTPKIVFRLYPPRWELCSGTYIINGPDLISRGQLFPANPLVLCILWLE